MLFNVTHSNSNFECNKERGSIDQLYIELGVAYKKRPRTTARIPIFDTSAPARAFLVKNFL